MKAQRALGLSLAWPRLVVVFAVDVALLVLASHWPGDVRYADYAWWTGVAVAALLTIIALVTYHRVPLSSALAARMRDRSTDPAALLADEHLRAVDHRRGYSRETVGMRQRNGQLVAVIAVAGRATVPSGRHHRAAAAPVTLPVELVAAALRQFDVRLDGIDIVSAAARNDDAEGPGRRNTWLILRMDPQRNVAALAARDSVAAALAAAVERLAHDLEGRQITASVLTADQFAGVDAAVLAGLQSRRQKDPKQYVTSGWLSPRDITAENLEQLWLANTDATVVMVRLVGRHNRTEVSAVVRYHSDHRLPKEERAGLNRFIGRRLAAVYASLPVPAPRPKLVVPTRELHPEDQLAVALDVVEPEPAVPAGA